MFTLTTRQREILKILLHVNRPTGSVEQVRGLALPALLGMDPVTSVEPDVVEVSSLLTFGWGPEGKDQAILFIAKDDSGDSYWYGLLFARDGFTIP